MRAEKVARDKGVTISDMMESYLIETTGDPTGKPIPESVMSRLTGSVKTDESESNDIRLEKALRAKYGQRTGITIVQFLPNQHHFLCQGCPLGLQPDQINAARPPAAIHNHRMCPLRLNPIRKHRHPPSGYIEYFKPYISTLGQTVTHRG